VYYNKFTVVHNTMRNLHMCKFTVYVDQEVCLVSKGLFENMNDELRNLSREMGAIEEFKGNVKDVEEVIENINSPLTIMVMGEFSTGKSTFINALMGEPITKVDAKPTTAVITKLVYGERDRIVVHYQDGTQQEYSREEFARLTAEADEEANEMHNRMDYVERTLPIDMLKSMSIIDSPGLNSIKSVHEDMTRHFMDKADTVLWMFDANKPGSQTEIDALKRLNPRLSPLVLVNKIDGIDEEEGDSVEGILEGVERRLENNKIEAQGYLGISAKMAFKGKTENRDNLVQASNIGAFYDAIEEKVLPGREQYKRNSLLDGLVKMIYAAGSQIKELRQKNEERKKSDYAAYVAMETELAAVWDELENIADIMLTDIENNQPQGRKRLNAAMKSFYGMLHWLGIFVEQDDDVARKYLEEAAVRGDEAAQIVLADVYTSLHEIERAIYWREKICAVKQMHNENIDKKKYKKLKPLASKYYYAKDYEKSLDCYLKWCDNGGDIDTNDIGAINYMIKSRKITDIIKLQDALKLLEKIASTGNPEAMFAVADAVEYDDEEEQANLYQKALDAGSWYAEIYFARKYLAENNIEKSLDLFKKAAQAGDFPEKYDGTIEKLSTKLHNIKNISPDEMYNKAVECYETGKYIESDKWYLKAAKAGHKESMCKAGVICRGKGRYNEALEWFHKAEHAGVMMATYWIGYMYELGEGVERDYKAAFNWYKRAANYKVSDAMFELGILYEYGRGVEEDIKKAIDWYQKAVDAGNWAGTVASGNAEALERIKKLKSDSAMQSNIEKGIFLYEQGEYGEALNCLKKAAREGKSDAMVWLGKMYEDGKGVGQDYSKAMEWYIKAANMGDPDAMNNMGAMYHEGKGIGKNYNCARGWYQKAINAGCDVAKNNLSRLLYAQGKYEEALSCFREEAEAGKSGAMTWLGNMYEEGKGVAKNYSEAMRWYKKAAETGDTEAMCYLGDRYYKGQSVTQNYEEAAKWFRKAADGGLAKAMNALGWCYYNGQGVTQNYEEAIKWYRKAAEAGNADGMNNLGWYYYEGKGVTQNYAEAVKWYRKAVEAGDVMAMNNLGNCYYSGKGVMQNYEKAVELYQKAAEGGIKYAMNSLGNCYRYGKGIMQNYAEAVKWYQKAVEAGDEDAPQNLADITNIMEKQTAGKETAKKSKSCFITTAVCTSFHKPDDCYELTMFRNFRDTWLVKETDGNTLISEYYRIAPSIVKSIDSCPNATDIYLKIWNTYLCHCLHYIEMGDNMCCKELYMDMVKSLEEKFLK